MQLRTEENQPVTSAEGRACGKAILVGEHFVLHGVSAVAVPVRGRHVRVRLSRTSLGHRYEGPAEGEALVGAMCRTLGLGSGDVAVSVSGNLPLAAGLGSSAALAVALVRASDALAGRSSDAADVRTRAHALEQLAHGRASGIDDAVVAWERPVRFDPDAPDGARVSHLPAMASPPPLWIAWTRRERSTREAVEAVAALRVAAPEAFMRALGLARESVAGALETLPQGDWPGLGAALARGQQALEAVGVVTAAHRTIVAAALEAGAWGAKTTGAGYGGAVLLLGPPSLNVASLLAIPGVEGCFPAGGAP